MGKRGRARQRRGQARHAQAIEPHAAGPGLDITIVSSPFSAELDVRHETQIVKAALLYADKVTLASPKVLLMASVATLCSEDRQERIAALAEVIGALDAGQVPLELHRDLSARRGHFSPQERMQLAGLEYQLEKSSRDVAKEVEDLLEEAGAGELAEAVGLGLVDLHPLGADTNADSETFAGEMVDRLGDLLVESVSGQAQALPVFDDGAGGLMRALLAEGKVVDPARSPAAEAGMAGRLIAGLEGFPDADLPTVLDIRERLDRPLIRFRAAVADLAAQCDVSAWDQEFEAEFEALYRRQVAPALLEIRETLEEMGALPTLRRVTTSVEGRLTAALGLTAASGVTPGDLPSLIYGLPAPAVAAGARELDERRALKKGAQANSFYFLYESERRLSP